MGCAARDGFGFASAFENDRYLDFAFGRSSLVTIDDANVLIAPQEAAEWTARSREAAAATEVGSITATQTGAAPAGGAMASATKNAGAGAADPAATSLPKHFFGTVQMDADSATLGFSKIAEEVEQHTAALAGTRVTIEIDIEATRADGFETSLRRTIKENCGALRFKNAEFTK